MAIGRPQMEEQIKGLQEGGEMDEDQLIDIDAAKLGSENENPFDSEQKIQDLTLNDPQQKIKTNFLISQLDAATAFNKNFPVFEERLKQYAYKAPDKSIFDLASALGGGILSAQEKGIRNPYVGIGVGFQNFTQLNRKQQEDERKSRNEIGLQAAQLALQSEQQAKQYLNQQAIKLIEQANKPVEYIKIEYDAVNRETGEIERRSTDIPNSPQYSNQIKKLISNQNGSIVKQAQFQLPDTRGEVLEKATTDRLEANEKGYSEKARSSGAVKSQLNEAFLLAQAIDKEGGSFGPFTNFTLKAREFLQEMGLTDFLELVTQEEILSGNLDAQVIAKQKALRQLSMSFTMAIVSQTKGAISDREMALFINASPTLGSTKEGFLQQLELLERIADYDYRFYQDYLNKKGELLEKLEKGELNVNQFGNQLDKFSSTWAEEFKLFSDEETQFLEGLALEAEQTGKDVGFIPSAFKKKFRDAQISIANIPIVTSQAEIDALPAGSRFRAKDPITGLTVFKQK